MLQLVYALLATARSSLWPQRELALQNLALRQQLAIVQRKTKRLCLLRTPSTAQLNRPEIPGNYMSPASMTGML